MSQSDSKNPDYLLTLVKKEESKEGKGSLKIFLGMAAGVGKTFAMLQAAQQAKHQKVDIVVGIVETHGRKDTAALLSGLEIIPRKKIDRKEATLEEFDVDATIQRRPKIVLVDELAHTNAPGSRHNKRYLDVLEILNAGIDVYTTLNVQHIESRVDTVREITNITIHETVPDSILDRADEVVLIDLPPDELLKRLKDGLIYAQGNAEVASRNFFQRGNLTALREMALRVATERVDRDLREYKTLHGIEGAWKAGGRLMVAVFASPFSETLIRWTRRVADLLGVTWIGAYVESGKHLSPEEQRLLSKNIALVTQLGGEVISSQDDDTAEGLMRIAHQNNVTQIMVGKSQRGILRNLFSGGSLVSRLVKLSGDVDLYVVATDRGKQRRMRKLSTRRKLSPFPLDEMGWLFATAFATWVVALLLRPWIGYLAVGIVFLLSVSVAGLFFSRVSVFILALIFALIHNFFFIPPLYTIAISKPEDFMMLMMFFVAAAVIGHLTSRISNKERILKSREARATTLYGLTKEIAAAQSRQRVLEIGIERLQEIVHGEVALFTRSLDRPSQLVPCQSNTFLPNEKERSVASWVMEHGQPAGKSTATLSASDGIYYPISGKYGAVGVLGIHLADKAAVDPDQQLLIEMFLHQIGAGLDRETYHEQLRSLLAVEEAQKLYKSLLDCVSHELKTPLATIKGSASALQDEKTNSNKAAVQQLSGEILSASGRLQRVVENLLDMTRIESGMLKAKREVCDVGDLIGAVLPRLESLKGKHSVQVNIPASLPPVICDPVLADQALVNLLHNAFIYTPIDAGVEISAAEAGEDNVEIQIRDHGAGLPRDNPEKVFEKFFRSTPQNPGGIGLGLSIAKGFLESQNGMLRAKNAEGGGAVFSVILPKGSHT